MYVLPTARFYGIKYYLVHGKNKVIRNIKSNLYMVYLLYSKISRYQRLDVLKSP